MPITVKTTIKTGVELIYKKYGSVTAFYYEPTAYVPIDATAYAATAGTDSTVTFTGSNLVLGSTAYAFSFRAGAAIAVTDFFALQFPNDYFSKFADFSGVTCA